jgi:hypothetical protein
VSLLVGGSVLALALIGAARVVVLGVRAARRIGGSVRAALRTWARTWTRRRGTRQADPLAHALADLAAAIRAMDRGNRPAQRTDCPSVIDMTQLTTQELIARAKRARSQQGAAS